MIDDFQPTTLGQGAGCDLLPSVASMTGDAPQRIPYPPSNAGETGVYGALTNGQRILGHANPAVQAGCKALAGALLRQGSLAPALRELVIVRVGYHTGSLYEVTQHRSLASSLGVSEAKLDAMACVDPSGLGGEEAAAIGFVDELLTRNRPSDSAVEQARAHLGDGGLIELILVAGNWWMLARMLETAGIPLDAGRIGDAGVVPAEGRRQLAGE